MNTLALLAGIDIPFPQAQLIIHQPTIKEISYIGEEEFFTGYELINFSKNLLTEEKKSSLEDQSNFDILIAILREKNVVMQKNRNCVMLVLTLLFPEYIIDINNEGLIFEHNETKEKHIINNDNFEDFKIVFNSIFNFNEDEASKELNPDGALAKRIADKLKKRHQKLEELKKNSEKGGKTTFLDRYISILTIGQGRDMNSYFQYTIYQLLDEFKRFQLKQNYDIYIQAKMAGAKDLEEVEEWMKDIHS